MNNQIKKYHLRALDFYICRIGRDIERSRGLNELDNDRECDFHMDPFLEGITNGEYIYTIYRIIQSLTCSKKFEINSAHNAVFYNLHCNSIDDFKDSYLGEWDFSEFDGIDCWNLYAVCSRNQNLPLHSYREKQKRKPLLTSLKNSEWSYIFKVIENEFFNDHEWMEEDHIEDLEQKLQIPSDSEYQKAVGWLFEAYSNIWYNKSKIIKKINRQPKREKPRPIKKHDFFDFMHSIKEQMAFEYKIIHSRAAEDPGTAGDQVEENWAQFLRKWLPANYPVITKGRLIDSRGFSSPQVDILVLNPSYPLSLRSNKHYFAAGVIAAFECKLTLRKEHLIKFFKNSIIIKNMNEKKEGNPYDELNQVPFYGLLATSHYWKDNKSINRKLHDIIEQIVYKTCSHPREMPNILCVADACTFYLDKTVCIGPHADSDSKDEFDHLDKDGGIITGYLCTNEDLPGVNTNGEILGRLIYEITTAMAFEDKSLRLSADYLSEVGPWTGMGKFYLWKKNILSRNVGEALIRDGYNKDYWSKWNDSC